MAIQSVVRPQKGGGIWYLAAFIVLVGLLFTGILTTNRSTITLASNTRLTEDEYFAQVAASITLMNKALVGIEQMASDPHFLDAEWKGNLDSILTAINRGYEQAETLNPPATLAQMHNQYLAAIADCSAATPYVTHGVETLDSTSFYAAASLMTRCSEKMGALNDELARLDDPHLTAQPLMDFSQLAAAADSRDPAHNDSATLPASPESLNATANAVANLRQGPGTDFPVQRTTTVGEVLTLVGRNAAGDWYQIEGGAWIAAYLVDNAPTELPVTQAP